MPYGDENKFTNKKQNNMVDATVTETEKMATKK